MLQGREKRKFVLKVTSLVAVCTIILTANFVGIFAMINTSLTGVSGRIPFYLVVMAVAFVGTIVFLEYTRDDGRLILVTSMTVSGVTLVVVVLGVEGAVYSIHYPERVFNSQLFLYLFAAGMVGTGIGYWGLRHWREFTQTSTDGL